jgi:hypothetical protein
VASDYGYQTWQRKFWSFWQGAAESFEKQEGQIICTDNSIIQVIQSRERAMWSLPREAIELLT